MPTNKTPSLPIYSLFLGLLWFDYFPGLEAATGKLGSVPGVYVFGDSLVDAGNNNYLAFSVSKANYPHNGVDFPGKRPTGRFSNGKNAADAIDRYAHSPLNAFSAVESYRWTCFRTGMLGMFMLSEKFGLPLPPPYLSLRGLFKEKRRKSAAVTGVNFASGGAGIFNSSDQKLGQAIPLSHQVNHWLSIHRELTNQLGPAETQIHLSKSLFTVVIGSNDLFDYFGSFKLRRRNNPQQYTQLMADKLKEQLKRIHDTGARRFLVVGVAQIGCTPGKREKNSAIHECDEEANTWCSLYNEALVKMLQQLKQELQSSITYSYFDNFKSLHDIISNPARYGFTDVTSACCGNGKLNADIPCLPVTRYCSDRTKYLFWDRYGHPTEAAARTFIDLMLSDDSQYSSPLTLSQLMSMQTLWDLLLLQKIDIFPVHDLAVFFKILFWESELTVVTNEREQRNKE
ncbi:hypothetical protein YC2023_122583 [Brassica napus]